MVHVDESEIPIEEEKDKEMEREGSLGQLGEGKVAAFIAQGRVILASNVFPPLAPRLLPVTLTQHLFSIALKSRQFCLLCSVSPQKAPPPPSPAFFSGQTHQTLNDAPEGNHEIQQDLSRTLGCSSSDLSPSCSSCCPFSLPLPQSLP